MLAHSFRGTRISLRRISTRVRPPLVSHSAFEARVGILRRSIRKRTSASKLNSLSQEPPIPLKSSTWSFFVVVGTTLTAVILLGPLLRDLNFARPQTSPFPLPQDSGNQVTPPTSDSALPRRLLCIEMPIPPGHLGNLTAEQELKLRELWSVTLKTFGVEDPNPPPTAPGAATGEPDNGYESPKSSKKNSSGKKRHALFNSRKHHDDDDNTDTNSTHSTPSTGAAADDDKYGQTKEFQQTLKELSPEELRSAFWSMVKADHPDALLLRFLRARKWDVQRALVMLISTMRWRSKEMHVDDDVMRSGEGGALADSKSTSDAFAKKEGEDFLAHLWMGKSFLHGVDKEGRPLCYVRVRLHKQGEQSERAMERYTVLVIETARLVLRPPVETAVCHLLNRWPRNSSSMLTAVVVTADNSLRPDLLHPLEHGLRAPQIHDQDLRGQLPGIPGRRPGPQSPLGVPAHLGHHQGLARPGRRGKSPLYQIRRRP